MLLLALVAFTCLDLFAASQEHSKLDYIVHLGGSNDVNHGLHPQLVTSNHIDILARATGSQDAARESLLYSYKHAWNGFSARLSAEEARSLERMPGVLSVYPSKTLTLHTTRSWDFLGLETSASITASSDVIIGVIDSGIWPESASFRDDGMGPVPTRWKGACVNGVSNASEAVHCTRKIIGARYYKASLSATAVVSYNSARDEVGHGTHTAATAAGSSVREASVLGLAKGTARGGAPGARLAIYKACWTEFCAEVDVLAAFDDAVRDGVDVISLSIGGNPVSDMFGTDVIAIGSYHAVRRGILVACSAGNHFYQGSVTNVAPWILTVGASSIDRDLNHPGAIVKPAPISADFSSKGPNRINPDIIKPDVTAPGFKILAAYPPNIPFKLNGKDVRANFALLSGTSMSCPHVSATFAYLKGFHPTWSPAAIKSAIMTTATTIDNTDKPMQDAYTNDIADAFSVGSGEIQPVNATDPGLVYDIQPGDYLTYLCSVGYASEDIWKITGNSSFQCPQGDSNFSLNYPSLGFINPNNGTKTRTVTRTVTNVGKASSVYIAKIQKPRDGKFEITVNPTKLTFTSVGQMLSYTVRISFNSGSSNGDWEGDWEFASLTWTDDKHYVKSPIAVRI